MNRVFSGSGECAPGQLWVAGMTFSEYPTPTSEDLVPPWTDYGGETAVALNGVLGVFTPPSRKITSILCLDACEVMRRSSDALHEATGIPADDFEAFYQTGTWYDPKIIDREDQERFTTSVLQVLINNGRVKPVPYISPIRAVVNNLHSEGSFVVVNTATLPGTEPGTIRTLQKTMPNCIDAVVCPRGYDNQSKISKPQALTMLCKAAGVDYENLPIDFIDDSNGHHKVFREFFANRRDVLQLAPVVKGFSAPDADKQFDTPVDAFLYLYALRNGRLAA